MKPSAIFCSIIGGGIFWAAMGFFIHHYVDLETKPSTCYIIEKYRQYYPIKKVSFLGDYDSPKNLETQNMIITNTRKEAEVVLSTLNLNKCPDMRMAMEETYEKMLERSTK